jgi:hypothetical protein
MFGPRAVPRVLEGRVGDQNGRWIRTPWGRKPHPSHRSRVDRTRGSGDMAVGKFELGGPAAGDPEGRLGDQIRRRIRTPRGRKP